MKEKWKKIVCSIRGHKYTYDSKCQPSRCRCTRCGRKWKLTLHSEYDPIREWDKYQQWHEVLDA